MDKTDQEDVDVTADPVSQSDTQPAAEFIQLAVKLADLAEQIFDLNRTGDFKFLSKNKRNEILDSLLEQSDEVRDSAKALHAALKQIKRQNPEPEFVDALILGNVFNTEAYLP